MINQKFDHITFIKKILQFSPRQGINEQKTAEYLCAFLKENTITFSMQLFTTTIPSVVKATLLIDGKLIPCESTGMVSGVITDKDIVVSSLLSSQLIINQPNINFNPQSDVISLSNFYFAPSIAISKHDLPKVLHGTSIKAEIKVSPYTYDSVNILVGNTINPTYILIAHYDSHKMGATDNASGVSVLMGLILNFAKTRTDILFVFSGNEEISFDKPVYWGHGFRAFEEEYLPQLIHAKKIFVIDSLGNAPTTIDQDKHLMVSGFPIKNLQSIEKKLYLVYGSVAKLMQVYHSDADTINQLDIRYLLEAQLKLETLLLEI